MSLRAAIFDLGGTLLHYHDHSTDDQQRHFRRITLEGVSSVETYLRSEGYPIPPASVFTEAVERQIAHAYRTNSPEMRSGSIEQVILSALKEFDIELPAGIWSEARQAFFSVIDRIVYPRIGLSETLLSLRDSGYMLGLISNTFWASDMHDRHLKEHGLLELFPVRLYSCDMPFVKPHPDIFLAALNQMGVSPAQAAYIGDRPDVDVAGAQRVGMFGVLIHSPYRTEEVPVGEPDAVIDELPELPAALKSLEMR